MILRVTTSLFFLCILSTILCCTKKTPIDESFWKNVSLDQVKEIKSSDEPVAIVVTDYSSSVNKAGSDRIMRSKDIKSVLREKGYSNCKFYVSDSGQGLEWFYRIVNQFTLQQSASVPCLLVRGNSSDGLTWYVYPLRDYAPDQMAADLKSGLE